MLLVFLGILKIARCVRICRVNSLLLAEVTSPPFEVTETGWGEFEAGIRLVFRDPTEQPLDLFHQIRLYPPASQHQVSTKKVRLLVLTTMLLLHVFAHC